VRTLYITGVEWWQCNWEVRIAINRCIFTDKHFGYIWIVMSNIWHTGIFDHEELPNIEKSEMYGSDWVVDYDLECHRRKILLNWVTLRKSQLIGWDCPKWVTDIEVEDGMLRSTAVIQSGSQSLAGICDNLTVALKYSMIWMSRMLGVLPQAAIIKLAYDITRMHT